MDGQIQYLSFNKKLDWEGGNYWNINVTDQGLALRQGEKHVFDKTIRLDETNIRSPVVRFTLGRPGTLFLLDQRSNLWNYDIENDYVERLFPAGHDLFSTQSLLACGGDTLYMADPIGPNVLSAISISNGQILWRIQDWDGKQLTPVALATGQKGSVYVLLQDEHHLQPLRIAKINPAGELRWLVDFRPHMDKHPLRTNDASGIDRFAMQVTRSGRILILDKHTREVMRFDQQGALDHHYCVHHPQFCSSMALDSDDQIYIGDQRRLSFGEEDDRFLVRFTANGKFAANLPTYRGCADELKIDENNRIYVWNKQEQSIAILVLKPRTMGFDKTGLPSGIYLSTALDSGSTEMIWHKLLVEAHIPEETQLRISYYASDRKQFMVQGEYVDMDTFITSEDKTVGHVLEALAHVWSEPIVNPKDALLFQAQGRYLWLKIELVGSEQHTPHLYKMRVYYPRMSLLSYLPAVYQEDEKSKDFLERYLSLFGTFLFDMEEQIAQTPRYFDAEGASGPFLKWLAGWLGLYIDDSWDEQQIRQLILAAPELYRSRGTRFAMEKVLQIYTGEKPIIVEHFQFEHMLQMSELRELMAGLYGVNPYQFCVLVKAEYVKSEKQRMMLETIVNEQKPAFTEARLIVLEPWIYVDMHTYLGVNTYLSEPSLMKLDYQSSIPNDTVLIDVGQENRIGVHTRVALDAELK